MPTQTDQSLPLTPTQMTEIVALGSAGQYAKMYEYIVYQMNSNPFQRYGSLKGMLISISPDAEDKTPPPATPTRALAQARSSPTRHTIPPTAALTRGMSTRFTLGRRLRTLSSMARRDPWCRV